MRILVLSTSSNNTAPFIGSLECLGEHQIDVLRYDEKWWKAAYELSQANPQEAQRLNHPDQKVRLHFSPDRVGMDKEMLHRAKLGKPDLIVYISAWEGDFVPFNETLEELNAIAPLVHFLCDGQDPPWWPQLKEFERRGCFSLTVNIDGGHDWPGGKNFPKNPDNCWTLKNALTLLTPLDTRVFRPPMVSHGERPYGIGYAGNYGGAHRSALVHHLQGIRGFHLRQRDDHPQSYEQYVNFISLCRVMVSVPFTGSGVARHVKGKALEAGYAGACLMEWQNEALASWFTPYGEWWPYASIEEGKEYAEWLAHHPKVTEALAAALQHRVTTEHSPQAFWSKVFAAVGK